MTIPADFTVSRWFAYKGDFCGHHRIVVVYETNEDVRYFIVTSQIKKAEIRSRFDKEALVKISPSDWDQITCPSCIECSKRNLKQISKSEMQKKYDVWDCKNIGEIPEVLKKRILNAICASVTYSEREKQMYMR